MTRPAHAVELPSWSVWRAGSLSDLLTIGIEEEFMLLDPHDWSLAYRSADVMSCLPYDLRSRVTLETHAAVMEIATGVHRTVAGAVAELAALRRRIARAVAGRGLRVAVAGTHPAAVWEDTVVSTHPRYGASASRCGCWRGASPRWPRTSTSASPARTPPST